MLLPKAQATGIVSDRDQRGDARSARLTFSGGTLVLGYRVPGAPRIAGGVVWLWDDRVRAWRCDAIAYPSITYKSALKISEVLARLQQVALGRRDRPVLGERGSCDRLKLPRQLRRHR